MFPQEHQWIFIHNPSEWSTFLPPSWSPSGPLLPAMDYLLQSPTIPLWALSDQVNFAWVHVQQAYKRLGFVTLKADNFMEDTYITEDQIKSALKSFPKLNLEDKILQATSDLAKACQNAKNLPLALETSLPDPLTWSIASWIKLKL